MIDYTLHDNSPVSFCKSKFTVLYVGVCLCVCVCVLGGEGSGCIHVGTCASGYMCMCEWFVCGMCIQVPLTIARAMIWTSLSTSVCLK